MWLDYWEPIGHVGFIVERADGGGTQWVAAEIGDFVTLQQRCIEHKAIGGKTEAKLGGRAIESCAVAACANQHHVNDSVCAIG